MLQVDGGDHKRASIYFVGPYKPIMCGIADYTSFITDKCQPGRWGMLSFDLKRYGAPLTSEVERKPDCLWYGIPDRDSYNELAVIKGLNQLGADKRQAVLWFQHEFGIWHDDTRFLTMLKNLAIPKIVTLHSLHFQSSETSYGLREGQYRFLKLLLQYTDAITVFSKGVYDAVTTAFPEHREKVYVIQHGIHSYPEISRLSRKEAKEKLHDYLLHESHIDHKTKKILHQQRILLDPETTVIGQTGFLSSAKGSELLYEVRNNLQMAIPHRRIAAIRIGNARDNIQKEYADKLRRQIDGKPNFLIETWLPQSMLPVAQRAFDINFYWPVECTQSGILAHALGAGAIIAGRDLEGVGETLKTAFEPVDADLPRLQTKMKELILKPLLAEMIEEKALNYAAEFSWRNQSRRHFDLADSVLQKVCAPLPVQNIQKYGKISSREEGELR
ncbi:MAG: hypothetical protein HY663_02230 [Chloroflexi bacterium]|nr:hypothetical protein [Chloroflexota bacterium]